MVGYQIKQVTVRKLDGDFILFQAEIEDSPQMTSGRFPDEDGIVIREYRYIYTKHLRIVEKAQLGKTFSVPFADATAGDSDKRRLEFTVTRLEPAKPKSPDEAVLTFPSPADAAGAPTEAEIRGLLVERLKANKVAPPFMETTAIKNLRISIELVADKKEDVKFYPMVGPARLHKRHYKCTAFFDVERQANWPVPFRNIMGGKEVFYIDRDNLVRATGPTGDKTSAGSPVRVLSDTGIVGEIVDDDRKNTP